MPSVHQTQPAQGQIWLVKTRNPDIDGYFPCGRMEAHSNAPAVLVHNTYLYLQSVEHLYLYTFRLCVAPYLLTPGCVSHLCGKICLLCILAIIIFIFFLLTLWRDAPGKLMTKKNIGRAMPSNFSKTCFGNFVFISLIYDRISVFLKILPCPKLGLFLNSAFGKILWDTYNVVQVKCKLHLKDEILIKPIVWNKGHCWKPFSIKCNLVPIKSQ